MPPCSQTKRLANNNWPLYETTSSGLCCYVVTVNSADAAANVVADAQGKPNYVKRSQVFEMPGNKIRVYLYFGQGN
jgi:hypothetical protein